jgi:hypothetical protein
MKRKKTHRSTRSSAANATSPREESARDYAVGYGRPPTGSRFKPGVSGNANGRPRGSKNLKTLIRQAMTAKISVQEGTSSRRVTKIEGVVLRQLQSALKGSDRSAMAVIKMARDVGFLDDVENNPVETAELSAADQLILQELVSRRRGAKGR